MDIEKAYSTHIFHFAFRWEAKIEAVYSSKDFDSELLKILNENGTELKVRWERTPLAFERDQEYNKLVYFHDYVRDSLFDYGDADSDDPSCVCCYTLTQEKGQPELRYHFSRDVWNESEKKLIPTIFSLFVNRIVLKLLDTGVGLLSFHLFNDNHRSPDEVLRINEYGRWLYDGTMKGSQQTRALTHHEIWIEPLGARTAETTSLSDLKDRKDAIRKHGPARLPYFVKALLGGSQTQFCTGIDFDGRLTSAKMSIWPLVDGKMFVVSWLADSEIAETIRQDDFAAESPVFLYKYIFVDAENPSCANGLWMESDIRKSTYSRWSNNGLVYGVTGYSFVCLIDSTHWFAKYSKLNMNHVYNKLVELALIQRASILKYQHDLSKIAGRLKHGFAEIHDEVEDLNRNYLRFLSKNYFREATAQIQGQELYEMLHARMQIPKSIAELANEIDTLHQLASSREEKKQSKLQQRIAYVGAAFLLPAFFTGFFGMNVFGSGEHWRLNGTMIYCAIIAYMVIGFILAFEHFKGVRAMMRRRPFITLCLLLVGLFIVLIPLLSKLFE